MKKIKSYFSQILFKNFSANSMGMIFITLINMLFVPLYIRYLGIEAFGFIGLFFIWQGFFSILDIGIPQQFQKMCATYTKKTGWKILCALRTYELYYLSCSVLVFLVFLFLAPVLCAKWIKPIIIGKPEAIQAIIMMGFALAAHRPIALYLEGYRGFEKHIKLNMVQALIVLLRSIVILLALQYIMASVSVFFIVTGLFFIVQAISFRFLIYSHLPKQNHSQSGYDLGLFKRNRQFFSGYFLGKSLETIWNNIDNLIFNIFLPFQVFGLYTFTDMLANRLEKLLGPIFSTLWPHLQKLAHQHKVRPIKKIILGAFLLIGIFYSSGILLILIFGEKLLVFFTGKALLSYEAARLLPFVLLYYFGNSAAYLLRIVRISFNETRSYVYEFALLLLTVEPLIIWAASRGRIGVELLSIWAIYPLIHIMLGIYFVRKVLAK